jgi:hypothetical protein
MSRFVLIAAVVAVMISSPAVAGPLDTEAWRDHYYFTASSLPSDNMLDPTDLLGDSWNAPPYTALSPLKDSTLLNVSLPANSYLILALGNWKVQSNRKTLVVRIEGVGATSQLQFYKTKCGYATPPPANHFELPVVEYRDTVGVYRASKVFDPQPSWEWIIIKNNGPDMTLPKVFWTSRCVPRAPSLTTWGLLALVGLLAATAIWVIRKRSTGLAT